ncbi:MAG: hypothetical protein QOI13_3024 [Paraburkholderia sp.]|jgi:hypothetical protein|nr:hypothetical protein [Paraburkholderia sp.]
MDMRVRRPFGHPMPEIAALVAQMKSAFGEQEINKAIRRGKAGEATFYAAENGRTVGTASPVAENTWRVTDDIRDRHYCAGCDGGCINQAMACKQWQQRAAGKGKS